jgi:hypothetical protein
VFIVGGGKVQRAALFQNDGVTFEDVPSVDDVASHWSQIDDLSSPKPAAFKVYCVKALVAQELPTLDV